MRNATAAQRPVKSSGVAEIERARQRAVLDERRRRRGARNVCTGAWPRQRAARSSSTPNATATEPTGTATSSQRGWRSRRSIRITLAAAPAISRPSSSTVAAARVALADDRALVHDGDAVGEREDLVEVLADQQHGDAARGRSRR